MTHPDAFDGTPTPLGVCRWLAAMDDPSDEVGMAERRTVTLTKIIDEARAAIDNHERDLRAAIAWQRAKCDCGAWPGHLRDKHHLPTPTGETP